MQKLAGGLLGGNGGFRLSGRARSHFVAGSFEIDVQRIKRRHGHLGAPVLHVSVGPTSVQAKGAGDIFRERVAVVALPSKNVADQTAGVHVENAAAGLTGCIRQANKNLTRFGVFLTVVPGLGSVDLGMMAARALVFRFEGLHFIGGIEVKNALAGIADHSLLAGADIVIDLRPQHYLARYAFMIAHFGDAGAAKFRSALVVAQKIFIHARPLLIAFAAPLGQLFFVFGGANAGVSFFLFDLGGFRFEFSLCGFYLFVASVG